MSEHAIAGVRWFLLAVAVLGLLQATVLFGFYERLTNRLGDRVPAVMRDARVRRAWPLFKTILVLALWWFFGTPAGRDLLLHANGRLGH
jgi:hypothetical protein